MKKSKLISIDEKYINKINKVVFDRNQNNIKSNFSGVLEELIDSYNKVEEGSNTFNISDIKSMNDEFNKHYQLKILLDKMNKIERWIFKTLFEKDEIDRKNILNDIKNSCESIIKVVDEREVNNINIIKFLRRLHQINEMIEKDNVKGLKRLCNYNENEKKVAMRLIKIYSSDEVLKKFLEVNSLKGFLNDEEIL